MCPTKKADSGSPKQRQPTGAAGSAQPLAATMGTSHSPKLKLADALPIWWRIARQWFTGGAKSQARAFVLACAVLACLTTWLAVQISYAQKHFSTGLAEKDQVAWKAAVWEFVGIICIAAPLKALAVYTEKRMIATWRASLSEALITAYTSNRCYFHMQLARGTEGAPDTSSAAEQQQQFGIAGDLQANNDDAPASKTQVPDLVLQAVELSTTQYGSTGPTSRANRDKSREAERARALAGTPSKPDYACLPAPVPDLSGASACVDNPDQRITNDVANYVSTSVTLVHLLGKKLLHCAAFAGVLWSISPRLVLFLAGYAFLGTFGTAVIFGRALTSLQQRILKLEADLRFGLVRLRENAEAIAFYSGDEREAADLCQRLAAMLVVLLRRIRWLGWYELWVTTYSYATILLPSLVLAPDYFQGKIPFGTLTQASYAFQVLEGALGLILAKLDEFSSLAAETVRLDGLLTALQAADVDAGGSGTVQGFEQPAGGPAGMWGVLTGLSVASFSANKRKKGPAKSEAGAADSRAAAAASDADDEEVGEATGLLVHADTASNRRASGNTEALPAAAGGAASHQWDASTANGSNGSGGGRLSRVLRLMDGAAAEFCAEELSAWVPGRHHMPTCVCSELSFSIAPGESLLVMGPSGCGKSSLLRVIAGLWTVGSGTVRGPPPQALFFLPQKPFMPLGNLRQQLLFPAAWGQHSSSSAPSTVAAAAEHLGAPGAAISGSSSTCINMGNLSIDSDSSTDAQLQQLLQSVRLGHLLTRFQTGLDTELDWAAVLSLGEQQRVALVRLLYHKPQLAFLDEATSALDPKSEALVYGLVRQACSSYVSVGHRTQLLEWHSHVLVCSGQPGAGHWEKYTAAEYKQRLAAGQEA